MGDDSIDMVILDIDMGDLVTLVPRHACAQHARTSTDSEAYRASGSRVSDPFCSRTS
jgi:hypothetical protein